MAALAVVEFLASAASVFVVLTGLGLLVATGFPVPGSALGTAVAVVGVGLVLVGLVLVAARSKRIASAVARAWRFLESTVGRLGSSRYLRTGMRQRTRRRAGEFGTALQTVAADRRRVFAAFLFSGLEWFVGTTTLYFCLHAVNEPVSIGVAMVAVPLSTLAGVVPVPAGVGGTELALAGVVVGLTATPADAATAAVLLFRLSTLGIELGAGGLSGVMLAAIGHRPEPI